MSISTNAPTLTDWCIVHLTHPDIPIVVFGIIFLVAATLILWKRSKTSEVETLVQANERFRNEVRNDLVACKSEAEQYKRRILELETQERKHIEEIENLKLKLVKAEEKIAIYEHAVKTCNYTECKRLLSTLDHGWTNYEESNN